MPASIVRHASRHRALLAAGAVLLFAAGCGRDPAAAPAEVTVYSSVDAIYAREVARRFTAETGIRVNLVSDSEETKSTGLLNRLLLEAPRPRADVFWSGDPVRAAVLAARGAAEPYASPAAAGLPAAYSDPQHRYTGFSARVRVLLYNRNLVPEADRPHSVMDLVNARFAGRACLANPLFGTTSMHAAALFAALGEARAREFFTQLTANRVRMLASNGEVRRRVAAGDFALGLADSDDANVGIGDGQPLGVVIPDQDALGALLIPNAAVLIARAPHGANGRRFIDYLLSAAVESYLAECDAAQLPLRPGLAAPRLFGAGTPPLRTMTVDYGELARRLEALQEGFLPDWVAAQPNP